jgi:hypothetical protein
VKELANRTSKATDEASAWTGSVRQTTIQAVSVIREIAATSLSIAAALEEQRLQQPRSPPVLKKPPGERSR